MRSLDFMKITEILRLKEVNLFTYRDIADSVGCSKTTVGAILNKCKECGLTYELARSMTHGEESPLYKTILVDKAFFDLFVDFKGYVDFFFLQDCVEEDYSRVKLWCGNAEFKKSALPETVEEYFRYIDAQMEFVRNRNVRIKSYCEHY